MRRARRRLVSCACLKLLRNDRTKRKGVRCRTAPFKLRWAEPVLNYPALAEAAAQSSARKRSRQTRFTRVADGRVVRSIRTQKRGGYSPPLSRQNPCSVCRDPLPVRTEVEAGHETQCRADIVVLIIDASSKGRRKAPAATDAENGVGTEVADIAIFQRAKQLEAIHRHAARANAHAEA